MFLKTLLEEGNDVTDLAFECMSALDSKLRLYSVMLAKLCLEKEPEIFLPKRTVLVGLSDAFADAENDKAASEALAALHIVIKNSIQVGPTEFVPEIGVLFGCFSNSPLKMGMQIIINLCYTVTPDEGSIRLLVRCFAGSIQQAL